MTDQPQYETANDSMMRGAEAQARDGERPVMEVRLVDGVPYAGDLRPTAPFEPPGLRALVDSVTYKRGWTFDLVNDVQPDGSGGLALHIVSHTKNSYLPDMDIRVRHAFLVPPATYSRDTWAAWIFDRVRDVETHEAGEFFMLDGYREFAPHHGNGEDPYRVWHVGDHVAARKRAGED